MNHIAILSDLHANLSSTIAVLNDIDQTCVDATYCLGDLVGYGPHPNETIELIRSQNIPTIMGNYDDGVGFDLSDCGCAYRSDDERERGQRSLLWTRSQVSPTNKTWLQTLDQELHLDVSGKCLRLVHGSPRRINEYLFEDRDPGSLERIARSSDCDVLLFGHTHKPWSRTFADVLMINTGSVGKPKDGDPRAGWLHLAVDDDGSVKSTMRRVDYDVSSVASDIRLADGLPDAFAEALERAT